MNAQPQIEMVRRAGGIDVSVSRFPAGAAVWWRDPVTNTTLMMYACKITSVDDVRRHMDESRAKFRNLGGSTNGNARTI